MSASNDGTWLLQGTQQGLDDVFAPTERANKLFDEYQKQVDNAFTSDEKLATRESRVAAQIASNDNRAAIQNASLDDLAQKNALAAETQPYTDATAIDNAIVNAQKSSTTRAQYDLGSYEAARNLDGSAGSSRREILGVAAQDSSLSLAARGEAKRILRGQDIVDTQALSVTSPHDALNEASRLGLIPQKIAATVVGDDDYAVVVGSSPPQRLDRRGITAMFDDLMKGNNNEGNKYRAEQDKTAAAEAATEARAAAGLASTQLRQDRIDQRVAIRAARPTVADGQLTVQADGSPITVGDAKSLLRQPEVAAYLADPAADSPLTEGTKRNAKYLLDKLTAPKPSARAGVGAPTAAAAPAAKAGFDPAVSATGRRLVDPITGK